MTLCVPRREAYLPLLHLVLGGIALRGRLSYDQLDDVQLAVDNLLLEDTGEASQVTMCVGLAEDEIRIRVENLSSSRLQERLTRGGVEKGDKPAALDIVTLLESLVDEYEVNDVGQGKFAVVLRKRIV